MRREENSMDQMGQGSCVQEVWRFRLYWLKTQFSFTSSLQSFIKRGGVESSQLALLQTYIEGTLLSNMEDRWVWDLNGEGVFLTGQMNVRIPSDECFLPKAPTATRWVKYVPIKINVFAWKVFLDRLATDNVRARMPWLESSMDFPHGSYADVA
ncbi:hypothetical protein Tco_0241283 [Tanacetum coccineum]